jgi:PIN domain nuclease of toxin-antitoxin system
VEAVYLDTNVAIWLADGRSDFLSEVAKDAINLADAIYASPMVLLELEYLYEIGKISGKPDELLQKLDSELGLKISSCDFYRLISKASFLSWTRDPFDRLVTAHAMLEDSVLITKDRKIREHYPKSKI